MFLKKILATRDISRQRQVDSYRTDYLIKRLCIRVHLLHKVTKCDNMYQYYLYSYSKMWHTEKLNIKHLLHHYENLLNNFTTV